MTDRAAQQADKELVRSRVRLDELARDFAGCELVQRGPDDFWACCPFHAEDTPSFHLRPRRGLFKCFGCGESGDVFSFVQKIRGVGFREALELLADRVGVTLGSATPAERRAREESRRQREVLVAAGRLFGRALQAAADGPAARYLAERGFARETLERFDVGLVPNDFTARLRREGVAGADLDRAGFTRAFGGRIAFGIRDAHGTLVGFGARRLGEGDGPKYVNTRETTGFHKGSILYGLDKASRAVAKSRQIVVMEGYTDVIMAHQRGVEEAVASMGTSLAAQHLTLLKGRARNLVFVFDGDAAGQSAAERAVRLALAEGLEGRILTLPGGADPCDWLAERTRDDFADLLAERGVGSVAFLCRRGLEALDPGQPGGREQVAREVLEQTRSIDDPVRREGIAAEIARECGVDRNLLSRGAAPGPRPVAPRAPRRRPVSALVRSQFVAVGGLAGEAGAREALAVLDERGQITHPVARRLMALGRELEGSPVDPVEWLDAVRERAPELAPTLDRLLHPPPDVVLPGYQEAIDHLHRDHQRTLEQEARRLVLTRPDLHADAAALRALSASLRPAAEPGGSSDRSPAGTGAAPPAAPADPDHPHSHPGHSQELP